MARLRDLHPRFGPATSLGPGFWELTFDCPKCGPPFTVGLYMHGGPAANGVWHCEPAAPPLDGSGLDSLTVTPSIGEPYHGKNRCTWHGHITKGEVTP